MSGKLRFIITSLTLLSLLGVSRPGAAQEATPAAGFIAPNPSECKVEPRSVESVLELYATPDMNTPTGGILTTPLDMSGEPADAATVAAITDTLEELYGCLHAGERLQSYALFTDNALRGFLSHDLLTPEEVVERLGPREAFRVQDVRTLADERVAAEIAFRVPLGVFTETWLFARQGERYLVEAVVVPDLDLATPAS